MAQNIINLSLPLAYAIASQDFLCIATGLKPNSRHDFYAQGVRRPYDVKPIKVDATNSFIDQVSTQSSSIQYAGTIPYQSASFGSLGDSLMTNEQGRLAFMWYFEDTDAQEVEENSSYYNATELNTLMYGKLAGAAPSTLQRGNISYTVHPVYGRVRVAGVRVIEVKAPGSYAGYQVYIIAGPTPNSQSSWADATAALTSGIVGR